MGTGRALLAAFVAATFVFASIPARACAVCGAAEQTLPTNGAEVPFAGRKRATLDVRAASFETTDRTLRVTELRVEPGASLAVRADTIVAAGLPILRRSLAASTVPDATHEAILGDAELRVSHAAWRALGRRLSLEAGVKLPTAPIEHDPAGRLLPPDLQPGCSSVLPFVGASLGWSGPLWSAWTSASILLPVAVRDAPHPGDSFRASTTLQLQPARAIATRLGLHGRLDTAGEVNGELDKRSGGGALHLAPEIVLSPVTDVVISFGASFPLVRAMRAYRPTSPVLMASVGLDF